MDDFKERIDLYGTPIKGILCNCQLEKSNAEKTGAITYSAGVTSQANTPAGSTYICAECHTNDIPFNLRPTDPQGNMLYNSDGTQVSETILVEVTINSGESTQSTPIDGISVYGVGGDTIAGNGNISDGRGPNGMDADNAAGTVGML